MKDVFVIGCGMTPVGRYADYSIGQIGGTAIVRALEDAGVAPEDVGAIYAGNMTSGQLCNQQLVSASLAQEANLVGVETITAEGACASGAAAIRLGYLSIASGCHRVVVVCGVEKMSHTSREDATRALATASDRETESGMGQTFLTLNATLMKRYIEMNNVSRDRFSGFSINAHKNAATNPHALHRKPISKEMYMESRDIAFPIRLYDAPAICDGAACIVLADADTARNLDNPDQSVARITASTVSSDSISLFKRKDITSLSALGRSAHEAYAAAGIRSGDVSFFEPHDAFTVITAISLEAAGFAEKGQGVYFSSEGDIGLEGQLPICTFGGLKARGHPVGASGVYQMAEAYLQLTDNAGENQVPDANIGMVQNISGVGTVAFTHILERS